MEISTGSGTAMAELDAAANPPALLVLTHGAGGGVDSADLLAARDAALGLGAAVARVIQPYRVRGARAPGSPVRQDAAWCEAVAAVRRRYRNVPLVTGGRSNGARLACRTAPAVGARGVVALAFPLHPPGRPGTSRAADLSAAKTDVLVVNGDRDPFGVPAGGDRIRVAVIPGASHALSRQGDANAVASAVREWLAALL